MTTLNEILRYLGPTLLLLNLILYARTRTIFFNNVTYKVFLIYLFIGFVILVSSTIMWGIKMRNIYLSHAYFNIQFILLSFFYFFILEKRQKIIVRILFIIILSIIGIHYLFKPEKLFTFSSYEVFLTSFPLVLYAIIHLYNSLNKKGSFLYINAAVLIYLSSSTLIFFLGDFLTNLDKQLTLNIWFIHKILYIIFLVLIFLEWKLHLSQYKKQAL